LGTNFVNSQIIVDDYGDEIYGGNLIGSHMSHNMPQTATFFSDSKNHYYKGGQQTMGKKPKNKRKHKSRKHKRAKHTRKKYSSEDELSASFDEDEEIDFN